MTGRETPETQNLGTPPRPGSGCVNGLILSTAGLALATATFTAADQHHTFDNVAWAIRQNGYDIIISQNPIDSGPDRFCIGHIHANHDLLKLKINLKDFIDRTDPRLIPFECIDGREPIPPIKPKASSPESPRKQKVPVALPGAKLAGGVVSLQAAFAMMGEPKSDQEVLALFGPKGVLPYLPGGHIDTHHSADHVSPIVNPDVPGTGCGASDNEAKILQFFREKGNGKMQSIVQSILGSEFDSTIYSDLLNTTISNVPHDSQILATTLTSTSDIPGTVDVLNSGSGHEPNHRHKEFLVYLNEEHGTTLNNNRLQEAHPDAQVFCVDMWFLRDIAKNLYPEDLVKQKKFLHGLVAYQVATYGLLTDGSQHLGTTQKKAAFIWELGDIDFSRLGN